MLNPGTILQNRYRIVSLLTQGGMGAVYRAWDLTLNVPIALKEMIPQPGIDPVTLAKLRQQFYREAQVLARLNHPNLVRVTNYFEESGNVYFVMDFVEGESLADLIAAQGALPETRVIEWAVQLLDALAYCHSQGVIHRDIKPQNIIVRPDGRPVLVDFGLVKFWDPQDPRTQTVIRALGTPEYAPPEQYEVTSSHTDPRSDLYSLGATLYHALVGFAPPTFTQRVLNPTVLVQPRRIVSSLSPAMEQVIVKALEIQPERRFQSATEMKNRLLSLRPAYEKTQPVPEEKQRRKPLFRPAVVLVAGLAGVSLLVLGGLGLFLSRLPQMWLERAEQWRHTGRCNEAIPYYQRVLNWNKDNTVALSGLAKCYEDLEECQNALQAYQDWALWDPEEPEALLGVGRSYYCLGNYESALSTFSETVRLVPERPDGWSWLVETYLAKGNYDQAMAAVNEMWAKGFETESVLLLEKLADKNYEPALLRLSEWYARQTQKARLQQINGQIIAHIPNQVQMINLDNRVLFLGYGISSMSDGQTQLDLYFQALDVLPLDYTIFLHAVPSDPSLLSEDRKKHGFANYDHRPPQPTTEWVRGAIYKDSVTFKATPGAYRFRFGIYHPPSATYLTRVVDGKRETYLEWQLIGEENAAPDQIAFLGWRQYDAGNVERAQQMFEKALSKDPNNLDALLGLSIIYAQSGHGDQRSVNERIGGLIRHPVKVNLGGANQSVKVQFLGYGIQQVSSSEVTKTITLDLYFQPLGQLQQDYTIWVHAHPRNPSQLSPGREKHGFENLDFQPSPPTSKWISGAVYRMRRVASLSAGEWHFYFGFYIPGSGERLRTEKGETSVDLGWVEMR